MDGEIDGQDKNLVGQLLKEPELLDTWSRYHLISDCLKQYLPEHIDKDLAGKVSKSLQKEPSIVAPIPPVSSAHQARYRVCHSRFCYCAGYFGHTTTAIGRAARNTTGYAGANRARFRRRQCLCAGATGEFGKQ